MSASLPTSFRDLLGVLPIPAFVLDRASRCVVGANAQFCKLMGYTEEELRGLPWPKILMPDYVAAAEAAMKENVEPEATTEWYFQKKDGTALVVHGRYRLTRLLDEKHRVNELYFTTVLSTPGEQVLSAKQVFAP